MRLVLVGGGTAGHVNPALTVIKYIKKHFRNVEILYVGSKNGMERRLVENSGLKFKGITVSGFSRSLSFNSLKKNLTTLKNIFIAFSESKKILLDFKPDLCFGTGGYVCGPFLKAATKLKIPYIIHEQNAYPGITTKLLSKHAEKILLGNASAERFINSKYKEKIVFTDNPIREEFQNFDFKLAKNKLNLDTNRPTILSFGGSLGAKKINESMADFICLNFEKYNFVHAFGKNSQYFLDILKKNNLNYRNCPNLMFFEYIEDMPLYMAACDIVISRAGAMTLAEICSARKPSILIPSPNVAENHQFHNAMRLVDLGIAEIVEEKNLNTHTLSQKVKNLLKNKEKKSEIISNFKKIPKNNATEIISNILTSKLI